MDTESFVSARDIDPDKLAICHFDETNQKAIDASPAGTGSVISSVPVQFRDTGIHFTFVLILLVEYSE